MQQLTDKIRACNGFLRMREARGAAGLRRHQLFLDAARELMRRGDDDDDPDLTRAIRAAIQSVSWLDTHHLETVREVIGDYDASISLDTRPSVVDARRALADEIAQCSAVAIAGRHAAVLDGGGSRENAESAAAAASGASARPAMGAARATAWPPRQHARPT